MEQVIEAIYENGVFRPLKTLEFSEGQAVQLIIHTKAEIPPDKMLQLAAEVYAGLSDDEIDEIEQIALDRRNFFEEETES
ncbi:antitoxin family protein [Leptolyngbya sp. PCC 6406]|uniref:antitoxin family protein n=1 Tax=Leptolyngbya sp. PCC 6406 TaxID=1173264 RepID=UPI0002AC747F|nr:antitoxin family protein [Leptolyngbya sp. PCC 6406]